MDVTSRDRYIADWNSLTCSKYTIRFPDSLVLRQLGITIVTSGQYHQITFTLCAYTHDRRFRRSFPNPKSLLH